MADIDGDFLTGAEVTDEYSTEVYPYQGPCVEGDFTGVTAGASVAYTHRAWNSNTSTYVFWTLTSAGPTGAGSGYNPAFLSDIVLLRIA